ncbi:hypothetical protein C8J57DRAFT_1254744 [Mycena rebaudengoi]|nr:hypothetical protein C8J57DRAFT_1254744 [Mycena rebaudengoi]
MTRWWRRSCCHVCGLVCLATARACVVVLGRSPRACGRRRLVWRACIVLLSAPAGRADAGAQEQGARLARPVTRRGGHLIAGGRANNGITATLRFEKHGNGKCTLLVDEARNSAVAGFPSKAAVWIASALRNQSDKVLGEQKKKEGLLAREDIDHAADCPKLGGLEHFVAQGKKHKVLRVPPDIRGVGAKIVFSESEAFVGAKKGDTGGERHKGLGGKWAKTGGNSSQAGVLEFRKGSSNPESKKVPGHGRLELRIERTANEDIFIFVKGLRGQLAQKALPNMLLPNKLPPLPTSQALLCSYPHSVSSAMGNDSRLPSLSLPACQPTLSSLCAGILPVPWQRAQIWLCESLHFNSPLIWNCVEAMRQSSGSIFASQLPSMNALKNMSVMFSHQDPECLHRLLEMGQLSTLLPPTAETLHLKPLYENLFEARYGYPDVWEEAFPEDQGPWCSTWWRLTLAESVWPPTSQQMTKIFHQWTAQLRKAKVASSSSLRTITINCAFEDEGQRTREYRKRLRGYAGTTTGRVWEMVRPGSDMNVGSYAFGWEQKRWEAPWQHLRSGSQHEFASRWEPTPMDWVSSHIWVNPQPDDSESNIETPGI